MKTRRITSYEVDGVRWNRYEYEHGEVIYQRDCPDCDQGLILGVPGVGVVFCSRCDGSGYLAQGWPPEATSDPPAYPFSLDRHTYEAPDMQTWRQNLPGGSTVAEADDLDMRVVRHDVGTTPRRGSDQGRLRPGLLRRLSRTITTRGLALAARATRKQAR